MPAIEPVQTTQWVDCQTESNGVAILRRMDSYLLSPLAEERVEENGNIRITLNPNTLLDLGSLYNTDDIFIQYSETVLSFSKQRDVRIEWEELVNNQAVSLDSKLNFKFLEQFFQRSPNIKFPFSIVIWREINLEELKGQGLIIERVIPNAHGRSFFIQSQLRSNDLVTPVLLKNYPKQIGNVGNEIISKIVMFAGARSESWIILVDKIEQAFTSDSYSNEIMQALREQSCPVPDRIPSYLRRSFQWNGISPLEVVVTIPELEVNKEYQIQAYISNPAEEILFPSGIPIVDTCLKNIHVQLLENGIPFDRGTEVYQRLLRQLLSYRYHCAHTPEYITQSIANQSEISGFHRHLHSKLAEQLDTITLEIVNEQQLGNSRVDMMIAGYPVELKLEDRRTADTDDIVRRYEGQAADYVARQGCRFGFLLILDTVLDRDRPTASLDQDMRFKLVQNSSGNSVIVIAIVIRIPRPASDFTAMRA